MARRRILIIATADKQTRAALAPVFSDEKIWQCVDAASGAQALEAVKAYDERITLFMIDAALLDADGIDALRYVQRLDTVDCPPALLLVPQGHAVSEYLPEDVFVSEVIHTPIERRVMARRLQIILDLHEYQKKDVTFQHRVSRDPLIGLLNGKALTMALDAAIQEAARPSGLMIHINVDNTRLINERSGYHFGDLVLIDLAKTLSAYLPEEAVIGRLHGDTFCAYLPDRPDDMENLRLLENLKAALARTYPDAPGGEQKVTVCMGAASSPRDGKTAAALLEAAGIAAGVAKRIGRGVLIVYSKALQHRYIWQGSNTPEAENDQLPPLRTETFMPVISAEDGQVIGYDYLSLRVEDDTYAVQRAIERMAGLSEAASVRFLRLDIKQFFFTIFDLVGQGLSLPFLSFYTVLRGGQAEVLPQVLRQMLAEYPLDPGRICIHVSQEMVMEMKWAQLEALARDIRALGFAFGIHNVGDAFIVNACYRDGLFDRIMFAPGITDDLIGGVYPKAYAEQVLSYFPRVGMEMCFPVTFSQTARMMLQQSLKSTFGSYGGIIRSKQALLAHIGQHVQREAERSRVRKAPVFRIGEDRFHEIFMHSGIVLFDWQPHHDIVAFTESFEAIHGSMGADGDIQSLLNALIDPDDVAQLRDVLLQLKHGRPNAEGIFRVRRQTETGIAYKWRRFFMISTKQSDGIVSHVYCISLDVDREQREMQSFKHKAETDPLTGLSNRGATEGQIRAFLKQSGWNGEHALLILDLDDFKQINDTYGHVGGDEALKFFAGKMQELFRKDDVIGRIGGDEYMVFLKNIGSGAQAEQKADELCRAVVATGTQWHLSCTVGISRYPGDGRTFEALYAKADLALYHAKAYCKGRYAIYSGDGDMG